MVFHSGVVCVWVDSGSEVAMEKSGDHSIMKSYALLIKYYEDCNTFKILTEDRI